MTLDVASILKEKGLSNTPARRALFQLLKKSNHPLSIPQISMRLKKVSPDLTTLYRNVTHLERAGLIHRVELQDNVDRYEFKNAKGEHHHHHVVCRSCKTITCVPICIPQAITKQLSTFGFSEIKHHLQFDALCRACSKKQRVGTK